MLSLTRKCDYALVALAYLGQQKAQGEAAVSARQIADRFGLPQPLLMNILKQLCQARIIGSVRGPAGGYFLDADPHQVTVLEVVTAIEGPMRFVPCADGLPIFGQGCGLEGCCPIREPIRALHQQINRFLEQMTLAELFEANLEPRTGDAADTPPQARRAAALTACASTVAGG